jgi:hypothetical protein
VKGGRAGRKARSVTKWLWGMFWRDTGAAGATGPSLGSLRRPPKRTKWQEAG